MSLAPGALGAPGAERERLRWQCRRGLLELDYLLERFLDSGFMDLDPIGRDQFRRLLQCQDQDLQHWILARAEAPDPALAALIHHMVRVAGHIPGDKTAP